MDVDQQLPVSHSHFVDSKVSSICWQPANKSELFATGSWGELPGQNNITVWRLNADYQNVSSEDVVVPDPFLPTARHELADDVSQIQFTDDNAIIVATGGGVQVLKYDGRHGLQSVHAWPTLHGHECTAFSTQGFICNELVTVGSDGRVVVCDLSTGKQQQQQGAGQPHLLAACTAVQHVAHNQVAVGSVAGQVHLYDQRAGQCAHTQHTTAAVTSLCARPSQPHLIAVANQKGEFGFIDLRRSGAGGQTADLMRIGSEGPLNQVLLHADYQENGYLAFESGALVACDLSAFREANVGQNRLLAQPVSRESAVTDSDTYAAWLTSSDILSERMRVQALLNDSAGLGLNALAVNGDRLLAAGDSAFVYLVTNLALK